MANGFTLGITVGASVGAAVAGIKSVKSSLDVLDKTSANLAARQKLLGQTLENPLRMTRSRVGELKREYDQLGRTIAKIDAKRADVAVLQQKRQQHYDKRHNFKDEILGAATAAGAVAVPVKLAVAFESSMADVRKVVDFDTPQQFKEMEQDILKMTRTIPMAGSELAKIAASGGQLGIARQDIPAFTETIAKMSVAFDMTAEQAGDSMAKLANVYNIPIAQIGKLGDAVNHLSNNSPAKASDIVNTLGRVGGVAKQFGLTELQTASLANAFISLGKTPEVAGTAVNGMLTKLMTADKQGKKFQAVLEGMGTDAKTLKKAITENGEQALMDFLKQIEKLPKENQMGALVDLFGLEYADDVAALVGGLDTYKKSVQELQKAGKDGKLEFMGSMEKEFAARSTTTANNWQLLKNGLAEIGITIGSVLLPALNQMINGVKPLINGFADWAAKNPEFANTLFYVAAGMASLKAGSFVFRFLGNEIGGLMTSFRLAKTLLGADWMATVLRFKSGVGFLARGFGLLKTVFSAFGSGVMTVIRFLPMLASGFLKLGMALMTNPIFLALGLLAAAAYLLYTNWEGVVGGAKALWQDLGNFFGSLWTSVTTA
ncbi:phage tail tape measure protein, partial [Neisseria weixii]|uniref:phage tail tape measure protein n=1 Tax=Neisseria weixii TaxID=1853276 RepID=UPI0036220D0D